jgi:hypothetical protein
MEVCYLVFCAVSPSSNPLSLGVMSILWTDPGRFFIVGILKSFKSIDPIEMDGVRIKLLLFMTKIGWHITHKIIHAKNSKIVVRATVILPIRLQ